MPRVTNAAGDIDKLLHTQARLAIVTLLRRHDTPVEFSLLREELGFSAGNLLSHLRALEQSGVIRSTREAPFGRTRTLYALTEAGLARVRTYARALRDIASLLDGW